MIGSRTNAAGQRLRLWTDSDKNIACPRRFRSRLATTRELSLGGSHGATISYGRSLLPAVSVIYSDYNLGCTTISL